MLFCLCRAVLLWVWALFLGRLSENIIHEVDRNWVEVIMGMVGRKFGKEQDMQVNGAVVITRNRWDKAAVCVRDKVGTTVNMMLGRTGVFKVHKKQIGK